MTYNNSYVSNGRRSVPCTWNTTPLLISCSIYLLPLLFVVWGYEGDEVRRKKIKESIVPTIIRPLLSCLFWLLFELCWRFVIYSWYRFSCTCTLFTRSCLCGSCHSIRFSLEFDWLVLERRTYSTSVKMNGRPWLVLTQNVFLERRLHEKRLGKRSEGGKGLDLDLNSKVKVN